MSLLSSLGTANADINVQFNAPIAVLPILHLSRFVWVLEWLHNFNFYFLLPSESGTERTSLKQNVWSTNGLNAFLTWRLH